MVQGKLLKKHPGSIHGGEETPGGQSSLRQGAGKSSSGAPDLGSAAAAEQWRVCEIGFCPRSFPVMENKWAKGGSQRWTRDPRRPLARPGVGPHQVAAWAPLAPLWPLLGSLRSFLNADFSCIFPGIFLALFIWGTTEIENNRKQELALGCTELI